MTSLPAVLITGCSSGIGRATAQAFLEAGYPTWATARRPSSIADLAAAGAQTLALDVTDAGSSRAVVEAVEDTHGSVGVLVNNAGKMVLGAIEELDVDELCEEFDTNVFGIVRTSQAVLPGMRAARSGHIINVGSIGGIFTAPGSGGYQSSKYAVESVTDALRMETARFGVKVSLIQPGGVATNFGANASVAALSSSGPYAAFNGNLERVAIGALKPGARGVLAPGDVARTILRAAGSPRPRRRYKVGILARGIAINQAVSPAWLSDAVMRRSIPDS